MKAQDAIDNGAECDEELEITNPADKLALEAKRYGALWQSAVGPQASPARDMVVPLPPPVAGEVVRRAALGFKRKTAVMDGIHPRHWGYLSDMALRVVALLLWTCEALGDFPTLVRIIVVALLPKPPPGGGTRPIGLYRSLVRLWGRLKTAALRDWEAQQGTHAAFNVARHVSTTDGVFRQAFLGEGAHSAGDHVCALR